MSFFFYTSGFCGWFHWVQNILSSCVHHVRSWSSTGMIRETLGTLRSGNGDTNENVTEKSGPMKLFPRRYTKSLIYLEVGKLDWSWREGTASEFRERWLSPRLAHKSSFWARSATVSAKRDRTSAERERASAKRERAKARLVSLAVNHIKWRHFRANFRAGSYHTRPENQANDFEKVYLSPCCSRSQVNLKLGHFMSEARNQML